jgi:group I intron endonuclease
LKTKIEGKKMIDKKEVKRQYKQNPPDMGIYQIRNMVNGKILIGCSNNLNGKLNSHRFQLSNGFHINAELQKEYKQYGEENFVFEIIDKLEPKDDPAYSYDDDLCTLEELWLEKLQPYGEKGYNKKKQK